MHDSPWSYWGLLHWRAAHTYGVHLCRSKLTLQSWFMSDSMSDCFRESRACLCQILQNIPCRVFFCTCRRLGKCWTPLYMCAIAPCVACFVESVQYATLSSCSLSSFAIINIKHVAVILSLSLVALLGQYQYRCNMPAQGSCCQLRVCIPSICELRGCSFSKVILLQHGQIVVGLVRSICKLYVRLACIQRAIDLWVDLTSNLHVGTLSNLAYGHACSTPLRIMGSILQY